MIFGNLTYLGLFSMQNLCKRVIFLEILRTQSSFAKFCDFFSELVFERSPERSSKLYLFRAKIIASHHYLFRVLKKEKYLFRVLNPTAILVQGRKFQSKKYVFRVLFVSSWTSLLPPFVIRVPPGNPPKPSVFTKDRLSYLFVTKH